VVLVVAVALILMLIAIIVVLLTRWRRHKRRRAHLEQTACADAMDNTFDPYIVDDAATQKLSCSGQTQENGLCQVSCSGSNASMSPRHPTSPQRRVSYTHGASDSAASGPGTNVENLMRTHNYGSNADELENAGHQPDTSRTPTFVGRSPAVTAKRSLAPTSVDSGEASKGLNNLNKAENYRKKSKCLVSDCLLMARRQLW